MRHLLFQPHHDGSPAYVAPRPPALGERVTVHVRTSVHDPVDAVWLRTVEDAEPFFEACALDRQDGDTVWWRGEVHVRNPVQRYRFMVVRGDSFRWLNQAGLHDRDVTDAHDFRLIAHPPAPDWGRDAVVYQVFPDRFARSAAADTRATPAWATLARWEDPPVHEGPLTPLQLYGGDLDGIAEHLDHLLDLGVTTLYLTPFFPAESNHRYNASTFDHVDPLLGGDDALRRLIDAAHAAGLTVMGDLTSNHTGDTHEWFVRATEEPDSPERAFYYFAGDGSHEGWKGHSTLPKLDHLDAEVGRRIRGVVERWLRFGLDGWRIDVANMTGRRIDVDVAHEVAREIRRTAITIEPHAYVVGEHGHDATGDLDGDGWHGTMNYYGFSFPVWEWVRDPERPVPSFGLPVGIPRRPGPAMVAAMRDFTASFGWQAVNASWSILGSHDSPRIRTITGSPARQHLAAALQFTLPGVPMLFAGDELGLEGVDGEDSRRTMPWGDEARRDTGTLGVYRSLAALRRDHVALRRGGLRWALVEDDTVGFLREHPEETLLVLATRDGTPPEPVLPGVRLEERLLRVGPETGPSATVWRVAAQ